MLFLVSPIPMWPNLCLRELQDEGLENLLVLIQCEIYSSIYRGVLGRSLKPIWIITLHTIINGVIHTGTWKKRRQGDTDSVLLKRVTRQCRHLITYSGIDARLSSVVGRAC